MSEAQVTTTAAPRPTGRLGRIAGWVFVLLLLAGIALTATRFVATTPTLGGTLSPESHSPTGARALAELLRQQGIEVEVVRSSDAAIDAVQDDAVLVTADPFSLQDDTVLRMINAPGRIVFLSSSSRLLRLTGLGEPAVASTDPVRSGCDLPEFARVGEIRPDRVFTPSAETIGCFVGAGGEAAVLVLDDATQSVAIVDGTKLLANERLTEGGNAALGLALLGQSSRIVWYVPSLLDGDITAESEETLGSLTPDWVTPVLTLFAIAAFAAILWRGRRFGPLVAESLPVTVRASETMHGRARLTERSADAPHAAVAIRAGAVRRLAQRLALGDRATPIDVAAAAADRLQIPRTSLTELLVGPAPASDADLIALARGLADLEAAVEAALRTERNIP